MPAPLPPALHDRLAALAARVRRLRVARGACQLAVAVLLSGAVLVLLDGAFRLSVFWRCALQVGWLGLLGALGWRLVVRPWQAEVPFDELARRVEAHFPELGERLLTVTTVGADPAHGSPQFLASLARETELRARGLDFAEAAPARPVVRLAVVTAALFLTVAVTAAAVPGTGTQLRRVGMPWYRPVAVAPFRVVVPSGDAVVRRGDPVTLSAYLERTDPGTLLPEAALLAFRDGPDAPERKLAMTGDGAAAFHLTRPHVTADFEYRVEAGPAASGWFTVRVADPVELDSAGTAEVTPPAYAAGVPPRSAPGLTDLDGLQYSVAAIRLRFTRPAASAVLEWRPEGPGSGGPAESTPVDLSADGTGGTASFRLRQNGTLRVVLVGETGPRAYRTETLIPVRVTPDAPPAFEQVSGVSAQPRTVRPGERVPVSLVAVDDVGVAAAELEYAVGSGPARTARVPIPLTGAATPRAEGRVTFDLAGKGGEGDTVRFRVRVVDNRKLDDPRLGPQEAVYPPGGWAELRLSGSAPPLDRQEVFGQRDALRTALQAARNEVTETDAELKDLREDTADRSPLPVDHRLRLDRARDRAVKAADLLRDAARDAALTPDLRPIATAVREVTDRPLRDATDQLVKARTDNVADRTAAVDAARKDLADAKARIEDLIGRNDRVARDRLDRRRLDALAADQKDLADRAAGAAMPREELLRAQQELLDRLAKLVVDSDPLTRGTTAAAGREARRLAADAAALAALLRDLDAAAKQLSADTRKVLLEGLARVQAALAERAAGLSARGDTAARLAGVAPPRPDDFRKVADLIARDQLVEALIEMERLAQALDRAAEAYDRWDAERTDARAAARQLALWQDDLRSRFTAATRDTPFDKAPDPLKAAFRAEQAAVLAAAGRLKLPPDPGVTTVRDAAVLAIKEAVRTVAADGKGADTAMKTAADALNRLAEKTPSAADRLARTRDALDRVRGDQDAILSAADTVARQYAGQSPVPPGVSAKLTELHTRQEDIARRFTALDLPGFESRQAQCLVAIRAAAADLKAGLPLDSAASLAWAKRELDRLKLALDTPPPPDDRADELARKQDEIAAAVAALGDSPPRTQLDALAPAQQEVQRLLAALLPTAAPEAPALLNDARDAVKLAEAGFRDGSKADELRRRTRAAADALARLADRLNARESDLDRVKRLAGNRRRAEEEAKKLAGKPRNPDASGEEKRQLAAEVAELTHTRVGAAGQPVKKRVLDLYARLQGQTEPDRQAGDQKRLAEALDELAAAMAEVPGLAKGLPRPPAAGPDEADAYLPSKPLADALRELARQQRAARDRANGLGAEVARQTRPAAANPLAAREQRQRALAGSVTDFARTLVAGQEPTATEEATRAAETARLGADRLRVGQVRPAKEAGEVAAQRLKGLAASAGNRPWGKAAADLAAKQEAILADLAALLGDAAAAAAQQQAWQAELAKRAAELAHRLGLAAKESPPGDPSGKALADAARLARKAEELLGEAARKAADGMPAEAEKLRLEAEKLLGQAVEKAAAAGGTRPGTPPPAEPDPAAVAAGDAIKQAEALMKKAADHLGPGGDPAAAGRAMREATDALTRAAKAAGSSPTPPPPDGRPGSGDRSNGGSGTAPAPTSAADLTPERIEAIAKAWGELPADVKAQFVQDLRAKYGDDYARAIKHYFEQLAERR